MSFNTTPLSYEGDDDFVDAEREQFSDEWNLARKNGESAQDFVGKIINATSAFQIGGTTVIDTSRNFNGGSGTFTSLDIKGAGSNTVGDLSVDTLSKKVYIGRLSPVSGDNTTELQFRDRVGGIRFSIIDGRSYFRDKVGIGVATATEKLDVAGNGKFSGTVTAADFLSFTGSHVAKSKEDLKLGELVRLNSYGKCTSDKQPDWQAEYCKADRKGNFGIVYFIDEIEAVEYSAAKEAVKASGVLLEVEAQDEVLASEACIEYHIACIGDAGGIAGIQVTNENGDLECGDYLVPSDKKGFAKKYTGDYVPLNHCGKIGENVVFIENETERIGCAWLKE